MNDLGELLIRKGVSEESLPLFRCALGTCTRTLPREDLLVARVSENLETARLVTDQGANQLFQTGASDEAEDLFRKVLHYDESILGSDHADTGRVLFNLAMVLWERERHDEAQKLLYRTLPIFTIYFGLQDKQTLTVSNFLKDLSGSEARLSKLTSCVYTVKLPNESQARLFLSLARPEDMTEIGLPREAIVGGFTGRPNGLDP